VYPQVRGAARQRLRRCRLAFLVTAWEAATGVMSVLAGRAHGRAATCHQLGSQSTLEISLNSRQSFLQVSPPSSLR
jgi:hypothetical protein